MYSVCFSGDSGHGVGAEEHAVERRIQCDEDNFRDSIAWSQADDREKRIKRKGQREYQLPFEHVHLAFKLLR